MGSRRAGKTPQLLEADSLLRMYSRDQLTVRGTSGHTSSRQWVVMKGTKTSPAFQLCTVRMLGLVGHPCRHFRIGVAIFFFLGTSVYCLTGILGYWLEQSFETPESRD